MIPVLFGSVLGATSFCLENVFKRFVGDGVELEEEWDKTKAIRAENERLFHHAVKVLPLKDVGDCLAMFVKEQMKA